MAKKQYLDLTGLTTYDEQIKAYIDAADAATSTKLTSGTIIVKEAEHADAADSATSATNASNADKLGGQLPSYYAKATDIPTGALADKDEVSESDLNSALAAKVNAAAEGNHSHSNKTVLDGITAAKVTAWDSAEANAKAYADSAASTAANTVKNDLLNGAGTAYDTLKELGDLIDDNVDAIEALEAVAAGKADKATTLSGYGITNAYTKTEVDTALSGKADSSHGTHVTFDSTNKPKMDGTAAFGSSTKVARADHVHPTDTSRASQADLDALESVVNGKSDSGHGHDVATTSAAGFMSADMVTKLNGIATGANKITVDSSLSSTSTNPVQNKVINSALAGKATTSALDSVSSVANEAKSAAAANTQSIAAHTSSINTHTTQISALQGLVGEGIEAIPDTKITALFSA